MGSITPPSASLPESTSPSLILTHPTPSEQQHTWSLTHPKWGPALTKEAYLARESYLTTVPLAKDGGISHWILTTTTTTSPSPSQSSSENRPILSSCETLRKPCITALPSGDLTKGIAYGIGSVFTDPQFRGRGYADRMLRELGQILSSGDATCSVLYSDIGREFYAKRGWMAFPSGHVAFPPLEKMDGEGGNDKVRRLVGYHELAELCAVDEGLVRGQVIKRARETGKKCVALMPGLEQMLWHLMREDYMTREIFGRTPVTRGAVVGGTGDKRVWAVWTRGYYGGLQSVEGNTLHILRFVVEDEEGMDEEELVGAFRAIIKVAQAEAVEWRSQEVQMWNPSPLLRRVIGRCGIEHSFVERDTESIASLMWYGEGRVEDVEWVANEKYGWC
ncbi:lysine acetyltransferase [Echria macrotheca]|uniref:Lysine acetyltransferase n=1 Tax=Echria macrotheca TaxID=438768 RepID=A0AAJ0F5T6_9PEZI|nr:lysine acetyltransferase [Echria macrotheca]